MPAQLLPFLLVVVVVTLIPGPDTALGLRNSLRAGTTGMWWTGLGCCAGLLVHAVISVLGLSALLAASATAYLAVKGSWVRIPPSRRSRKPADLARKCRSAGFLVLWC